MRDEKQLLLDEIKEKLDASNGFIVARYQNFGPNLSHDLRTQLTEQGGLFEIVRKRVFQKVLDVSKVDLKVADHEGHLGVIFSSGDTVQLAKAIYKFSDENQDVLQVVCGRFEGQNCSAVEVEQISKLPAKDQMRAQFLGTLEAPMSQTLAVVEAMLTTVMHCLENKSKENSSS